MNIHWDWYYNQIKDASLEIIEKGQHVQMYRISKYPNSSTMSTVLIFTEFAVIITGDLRVTQKGCQALGYGLDWFTQRLDGDYLAGKFLDEKWIPALAVEYWTEVKNEYKAQLLEYERELEDDQQPDEKLLKRHDWKVMGKKLSNVTIIEALDTLLSDGDNFSSSSLLYENLPAYKENDTWNCAFDGTCMGGYGYQPGEVGWLAAIQRRFAELYKEYQKGLEK